MTRAFDSVWIIWITVILVLPVVACTSQKTANMKNQQSWKDVVEYASSILESKPEIHPNGDSSLVLCLTHREPITWYVVLNRQSEIIAEKSSVRGKVSWYSESSIQIMEEPGVIEDKSSKPSDHMRIIELKKEI